MVAPRRINVIDMFHGDNREKIPDFVGLKSVGILAVLHKASQGLHYVDSRYSERRKACEAAGLLFGAYHFLDHSDPVEQAKHFLDCAGASDNAGSLAFAADYEENGEATASLQQLLQFIKYIENTSSAPPNSVIIYSGNLIRETLKPLRGGHQDPAMLGVEYFFQRHRLWLAEYGPHENVPWPWNTRIADNIAAPGVWLWQFTEKGRVNPIIGNVDGNYYSGSPEQLAAEWVA